MKKPNSVEMTAFWFVDLDFQHHNMKFIYKMIPFFSVVVLYNFKSLFLFILLWENKNLVNELNSSRQQTKEKKGRRIDTLGHYESE